MSSGERPSGERWFDDEAGPVVRPYALVGGRTPAENFDVTAVVTATGRDVSRQPGLEPEHLRILDLSARGAAVAEIAAEIDLPLDVVRVLVGDLRERGLVTVRPPASADEGPGPEMLNEVLQGLRAL